MAAVTFEFIFSSLTAARKYISERNLRPLLFLQDEAMEVSKSNLLMTKTSKIDFYTCVLNGLGIFLEPRRWV